MTPDVWVLGWIGFLIVGLGVAAFLEFGSKKRVAFWLLASQLLGALAFLAMGWTMRSSPAGIIVLPSPWPVLHLAPLPLAPLWSIVAAVLFGSATVGAYAHSRTRHVLYALLPLQTGVAVFLWSGDGLWLLLSWEFLSASTYLGLVTTRRARPVWNAGWALLTLSELGGMLLLLGLIWLVPSGHPMLSDSFRALASTSRHLPAGTTTTIMVLALVAFGVKAGLFPVLIWMPLAEPEAPGVVAGLFSGLLTALAISGILALEKIVHAGITWGIVLLVLGSLGALTGALYSIVSRHVRRILAYSTLEILGLVFAALGIWRIETLTDPGNIAGTLALEGAVVLLLMHAGSKFALFALTDYTNLLSKSLDQLGGLLREVPGAGWWALLGTVTLAGIPPLGGFLGEWLLLESILKPLGSHAGMVVHGFLLLAAGFLALAMAIGVATYLRWYSFVFLGPRRHLHPAEPKDGMGYLWWASAIPALGAALVGPSAPWLIPWLDRTLTPFLSTPAPVLAHTLNNPASALPLVKIGANLVPAPGAPGTVFFPQGFSVNNPYVLLFMGLLLGFLVWGLRALGRRRRPVRLVPPWTGGAVPYQVKTSFTAEGFVHPIRLAFASFYGLKRERRDIPAGRFYRHTIVYRLEDQLYRPILVVGTWLGTRMRRIQSGQVSQYVAYLWIGIIVAFILSAFNT